MLFQAFAALVATALLATLPADGRQIETFEGLAAAASRSLLELPSISTLSMLLVLGMPAV